MSNPYSQPSISGYNASPPADDGTEVTTNQLKWSNHKTKLGDPLKTFAEAIDAAALAAFGLTFGTTAVLKTTAYTVTTADRGRFISVTGTTTITLPAAATAGVGFPLLIVNTGSAVVTIDGDGSETINGNVTITLFPNDWMVITSDGSSWTGVGRYAITGSFSPTYTGFSVDPGNVTYLKRGNSVWLRFTSAGTSNASTFTITDLPASLRPAASVSDTSNLPINNLVDGGVDVWGSVRVEDTGVLTFATQGDTSGWTPSGNKGFSAQATVHYPLRYS